MGSGGGLGVCLGELNISSAVQRETHTHTHTLTIIHTNTHPK